MSDDLRSAPVLGGGLVVVAMVVMFVVVLMGANWLVETLAHWGL